MLLRRDVVLCLTGVCFVALPAAAGAQAHGSIAADGFIADSEVEASAIDRVGLGLAPRVPDRSARDGDGGERSVSDRSAPGRTVGAPTLASLATLDRAPSTGAGPRLEWRSEHRRLEWGEGLFGGAMAGIAAATYFLPPNHSDVNWRGGIALDDSAWRGLSLSDLGARETMAHVSDALTLAIFALPLIDAIAIAWAGHGSSDVMGQMLLMDFQAHAMAQGLTGVVKWAVRRERPLSRSCREDASRAAADPECNAEQIEPTSFFSGHTSLAFTSAALVCLHHTELGLLGEAGSAAACATSLALAGSVGVMRMMAERHYLSDVAVGAAVGMLSGWLFPYLLHYAQIDGGEGSDFRAAFAPTIDPENLGLTVMGTF